MNQIIIASHSELAKGMKKTIEFFAGDNNIEVLEQTLTDTGFESKVISILEKYKDKNCIVFTDLYGGSVNQIFYRLLTDYKFHLVTGMNLSVILECVFMQDDIDADYLKKAIEQAKSQFTYMNDIKINDDEED